MSGWKDIKAVALSAIIALSSTVGVAQANPLLGSASAKVLSTAQAEEVVGQGSTASYYAYLGALYGSYAYRYGAYAQYLDLVNSSADDTFYYYAYYYAYYSYTYYYYAYYYRNY